MTPFLPAANPSGVAQGEARWQSRRMSADVFLHQFTADEYHRMAGSGAFAPDARVELWDGKIIDMFPIGPFHSGTVTRLNHIFERANRDRWITSIQNPIRLSPHYEPQPDLVLLKPREDFYTEKTAVADEVLLLVEVCESSILVDREEKVPAYASAGIPETWLINVPEKKVEVFRDPRNGVYVAQFEAHPGNLLTPEKFSDVAVDLKSLFRV
jgi:Uma2 family endonuclease